MMDSGVEAVARDSLSKKSFELMNTRHCFAVAVVVRSYVLNCRRGLRQCWLWQTNWKSNISPLFNSLDPHTDRSVRVKCLWSHQRFYEKSFRRFLSCTGFTVGTFRQAGGQRERTVPKAEEGKKTTLIYLSLCETIAASNSSALWWGSLILPRLNTDFIVWPASVDFERKIKGYRNNGIWHLCVIVAVKLRLPSASWTILIQISSNSFIGFASEFWMSTHQPSRESNKLNQQYAVSIETCQKPLIRFGFMATADPFGLIRFHSVFSIDCVASIFRWIFFLCKSVSQFMASKRMQWAGWENRWNVRGGVTQQAIIWFRWKCQHGDVAPEMLPRWIQLIFGVKLKVWKRQCWCDEDDYFTFQQILWVSTSSRRPSMVWLTNVNYFSIRKFAIHPKNFKLILLKWNRTRRNKKRHFGKQILMGFCGSLYFLINVSHWGIRNCQPKDKQYGTEAVLLLSRRRFDYYSIRRRFWFDTTLRCFIECATIWLAFARIARFLFYVTCFPAAHSLFRQVIERLVAICEIVSIVILLRCGRHSLGLQSFLFAFGRLFLESIIYSFDLNEVSLHTRTALNLWSSGLVAEVIGLWRLSIEASSLNEFWMEPESIDPISKLYPKWMNQPADTSSRHMVTCGATLYWTFTESTEPSRPQNRISSNQRSN